MSPIAYKGTNVNYIDVVEQTPYYKPKLMKTCAICQQEKFPEEFPIPCYTKDGEEISNGVCKECYEL